MSFEGIILGVGVPMLDVLVDVSSEFLHNRGLLLNNAIPAGIEHEIIFQEITAMDNARYIPGGATLNAVRGAQWMLGEKNICSFIGSIGNDDSGKKMLENCNSCGVVSRLVIHEGETENTGICGVLVNNSERSLLARLGAGKNLKLADLLASEASIMIEKAQYIYCAGYLLECDEGLDCIIHLGRHVLP